MNILNEISIDYLTDSKVLCETPAKLKLREKTLNGINQNLSNINILPGMMLAKKKPNEEEQKKETNKFIVTEPEQIVSLEGSKRINVSSDELKIIEGKGLELMNSTNEEVVLNSEPEIVDEPVSNVNLEPVIDNNDILPNVEVGQVPEVQVDEIPITIEEDSVEQEQPVVEENVNVVTEEPVIEHAEEPVMPEEVVPTPVVPEPVVEEVKEEPQEKQQVPSIDEIREKIIPTKVNTDDVFKENDSLREEVTGLQQEQKKNREELDQTRTKYNDAINISSELDKTYADRQREAQEAEKVFYDALAKQKSILSEMKASISQENAANRSKIKELSEKTSVVEEANSKKEADIRDASDKIARYKELLSSIKSLDLDEIAQEEAGHSKAA